MGLLGLLGLLALPDLRDTMVPRVLPVLQGPQDLLDRQGLVTFHVVLTKKKPPLQYRPDMLLTQT